MRRWMAAPLLFALLALLATLGDVTPVVAQDVVKHPDPVEENFNTADGVRLKGLFHKSGKPTAGNPVVILLYQPGPGNTIDKPGDWSGLTKTLNDKGFHVFRFDWRGHGKSKDIIDTVNFWENTITGVTWNKRLVAGANMKPVKNTLDVKVDLAGTKFQSYFPMFAQDLAAVRNHLDGKNDDQKEINTSSIYLIGAGDTAALGMLWMTSEWYRPAKHPLLGGGQTYKLVPTQGIIVDPPAGEDIAGAIWLSASRPTAFGETTVKDFAKSTKQLRDNNPMLFLYGATDATSKTQGKFFFDQVLVANGNKTLNVKALDQTFMQELKNTKLKGDALLGKDAELGTESTIVKYLEARQKDRATKVRRNREYPGPYFIDLGFFGFRSP